MTDLSKIRLILDSAHSASFNMAADEYLLEQVSKEGALSVLRIYFWSEPAVSVGYFQNVQEIARRLRDENKKLEVVRRVTGGGLVRHGDDLTFSLIVKNGGSLLPADVKLSYWKVNEALRTGFKDIYPELEYAECQTAPSGRGSNQRICFEQPTCYDLLLGNKKIAGASQRRIDGAILHQGTVFLKDPKETLAKKIIGGFRKNWKIDFEEIPLSAVELEAIRQKETERKKSVEWGERIS